MIQKADADKDGLINEEEFYNVMTRKIGKWYTSLFLFISRLKYNSENERYRVKIKIIRFQMIPVRSF